MGRAPCCEKVGLKKGRWTAEEDEILAKYIAANGEGSWRSLPKDAGLLRCGKSCRLRWINYLRSDLKRGNITKEEEEMIVKLHATLGNRWSLIAGHLPGRTDNEVKNYWNSHLSKRVHVFGRTETESEAALVLDQLSSLPGGGKWRGAGRTSSSTKKTMNNGTNKREKKKDMVVISPTASLVQNHQNQASSVTFDDQITNEGLMDPNEEMVSHLLYTSPGDSRFWDTNADMELVSMDEGDSGVMSLSEERESGAPSGLDVRRGIDVVGKSEEEEGSCRGVKLLDWDLDGMVSKLWDEAGEMWPWIWDSGTGESGLHEGD